LKNSADSNVAQVSKPAVSRVSKPADAGKLCGRWFLLQPADWEIGDTAGLETCATILSTALRETHGLI
jgi:hypothetical protein